jgi:hypothetical protein
MTELLLSEPIDKMNNSTAASSDDDVDTANNSNRTIRRPSIPPSILFDISSSCNDAPPQESSLTSISILTEALSILGFINDDTTTTDNDYNTLNMNASCMFSEASSSPFFYKELDNVRHKQLRQ